MKPYLTALAVGLLVGVIYGLLNERSPAPPVIALVGLLGILAGEQLVPVGKKILEGQNPFVAWKAEDCTNHMFGVLPGHKGVRTTSTTSASVLTKAPHDGAET